MSAGAADRALDDLSAGILGVLAETPGAPVSLPRLAKRLGVAGSTLLRHFSAMDESSIGGLVGPGWIAVMQDKGQWRCALRPEGAERYARHLKSQGGHVPPP